MNIIRHVPNFITCLNLTAGALGVIWCRENLPFAAYMIFIACLFDFIDGFAARLLKASSPIGKELDSLADMVSFGLLPGLIVFHIIGNSSLEHKEILKFAGLLIPVFSALRLAKFNIDERQSYGFIGVPTPANAILFASFALIFGTGNLEHWQMLMIAVLSVIMSLLLVSEIPLFALKFKSFAMKENLHIYLFLAISAVLVLIFGKFAVPGIIFLYILTSLGLRLLKKS
jgi:CDP-diacylglycerol---serine O-phosphatidyltransferase